MKALTIHQPYASLIALGRKRIETRSFRTHYRGPLAIHAAARTPRQLPRRTHYGDFTVENDGAGLLLRGPIAWPYRLPVGCIVATAELVDCVEIRGTRSMSGVHDLPHEGDLPHQQGGLWIIGVNALTGGNPTRIEHERPFGNFEPGRFAWLLDNVVSLGDAVIPAKGKQALWNWEG